jgi:4-hydroxy-tetrahydrodipicolinate synthase
MDVVGRPGGRCRPPRVPLSPEQEAVVRAATEKAVAAGLA